MAQDNFMVKDQVTLHTMIQREKVETGQNERVATTIEARTRMRQENSEERPRKGRGFRPVLKAR